MSITIATIHTNSPERKIDQLKQLRLKSFFTSFTDKLTGEISTPVVEEQHRCNKTVCFSEILNFDVKREGSFFIEIVLEKQRL